MYCHASVKGQRPATKKPTKCKQPQQPPTTTTTTTATAKRHKRTTPIQNIELLVNDNSLTSQLTTPALPSRPPLFNCFSAKKTNYTTPSLFGNRRHYRRNNAMSFRLTTAKFASKSTKITKKGKKQSQPDIPEVTPNQQEQDTLNQQKGTPKKFQTYVVFIIVFEKLCIDINLLLTFAFDSILFSFVFAVVFFLMSIICTYSLSPSSISIFITSQPTHPKFISFMFFSFLFLIPFLIQPMTYYSALELYDALYRSPSDKLLPGYKKAVQQAEDALVDQQNLTTGGNIPLYQAKLDVAKYQLDVHLWEKVIKLFPRHINAKGFIDKSKDANTDLANARNNLNNAEAKVAQLGGGGQPQNLEYVLLVFEFFLVCFVFSFVQLDHLVIFPHFTP